MTPPCMEDMKCDEIPSGTIMASRTPKGPFASLGDE